MALRQCKVGLWLIGACGGVGSTVALGLAALRKQITDGTGLVTELPQLRSLGLVSPGSIVLGGHEVRSETLLEAVRSLHTRAGLFKADDIRACAPDLRAMQRNIRTGTLYGASPSMRRLADRDGLETERCGAQAIERLTADITAFRRSRRLDHVVVIHIASSEPRLPRKSVCRSYTLLRRELTKSGSTVLPCSCLYALAAIEAHCPFIDFTPSQGLRMAAVRERAEQLGVPYMGSDGKTGETLVKSILAPMFAMRNLAVLSWSGQNILGNRDGATLQDPRIRESKLRSKDKALAQIIGPHASTYVSIGYVPSLDDWKVAWDYVHFQGFLGTRMSMQFTWHGSDSLLAAPLIIDLARLTIRECGNGCGGPMRHLACFFKDPISVNEHNLFIQWQHLLGHLGILQHQADPRS
ncbi:MAG: inositol-3-phosphate synthase [Phycisphaerae bacterium]